MELECTEARDAEQASMERELWEKDEDEGEAKRVNCWTRW